MKKHINLSCLFVLFIIIFEFVVYAITPYIENNIKIITEISICIVAIIYLIYSNKKKIYNWKSLTILVLIIGVLLRTMYIIETPITLRQYDVFSKEEKGHLGYIYTIYDTGHLPQDNEWQFYHPPLMHLIGAGWLKVNDLINIPLEQSLEGLQVLTVIFSSLTMLVIYRIIEKLNIKDKYQFLINVFFAFYPSFILLSGSINNDCLLTLLQFLIILYLIKWYENTTWFNTIILSLVTGLCVMTKLNGAIMSIPILYVFIKKLIDCIKNSKTNLKVLLGKLSLFCLISLPIGLWYPIRNYILFNQGISHVLRPSDFLYTGDESLIIRFFSISWLELFGEIICIPTRDYNIFAYVVKSSLFGDYFSSDVTIIQVALLMINFALIIFSLITIIKYFIKRKEKNFILNLLLILWITNIISFVFFNIKYPYGCSMDFRYIIPTVVVGVVLLVNYIDKTKQSLFSKVNEILMYFFIVLSCAMFFTI